MRATLIALAVAAILTLPDASAGRGYQGCCSRHGGITYQCVNGRMLCADGTLSPSCFCGGNSPPLYSPPLYSAPLYTPARKPRAQTYTKRQPARPSARAQFRDWIVTTLVNRGNVNASVEAYTEYRGSSFREQFSRTPHHSGGLMKGPRGAEYNIGYVFITDCGAMENGRNVRLSYSFNQSGRFTEAKVLHYEYGSGKITVYFQPADVPRFHESCIRGSTITLKVANSGGETWTRFVLYGFTRAMGNVYERLL